MGVAYDYDSRKICCGSSYVQANTSLCCQNSIGQFRVSDWDDSLILSYMTFK